LEIYSSQNKSDVIELWLQWRCRDMTLLQHEIDIIADRILEHVADRLVRTIRATIREEMNMTDQAILDLTKAVDDVVGELVTVVTDLQADAATLAAAVAASSTALDPAIAAQTQRLVDGTKAAAAAVAALTPAAAAVSTAAAAAPDPAASGASGATA
jgi:hypothetical protein